MQMIEAFGRKFDVRPIFIGIKHVWLACMEKAIQEKGVGAEIFFTRSDWNGDVQCVYGKVLAFKATPMGTIIMIEAHKERNGSLLWDYMDIWISKCGGNSGVLASWKQPKSPWEVSGMHRL